MTNQIGNRLAMGHFRAMIGLCFGAVVFAHHDVAAQVFDNPTMGEAPCVFLNRYEVDRSGAGDDGPLYRGSATIENVCGRALEVQFCFNYAPNEEGVEQNCFRGPLRPWSRSNVVNPATPARITGPSYEWRYLP